MDKTSPKPRKKGRLGPKLWTAVTVILLISAAAWWYVSHPSQPATPAVTTISVSRTTLEKTVAATGKVEANFEVEIKGKGSGKITKLPYDVSDYVPKGALLVELDPIDEVRAVNQSAATLSSSQSKLSQAQLNLQVAQRTLQTDLSKANADLKAVQAKQKQAVAQRNRLEVLVQNRYISQQEYETGLTNSTQSNTDLANARTRLKELQTQQIALAAQQETVDSASADARAQKVGLDISEQRLSETRIYAPIAGVVSTRTGQLGQIVASGISNVGGGTAIMTLADLSRIFVLASVDESDIGVVKEGQAVDITADSFPGQHFQGKVVRIAPKGVVDSNVVTFEVKIEVLGANKNLLKPEMTTNVEILIDHKPNVFAVPVEAVLTRNGHSMVRVLNAKGEQERRRVMLGLNTGTEVEILSGLSEGDKVVANLSQGRSHWRKDNQSGQGGPGGSGAGGGNGNRRGQMMMMRGMGKR
jgi:HlyD family secretion protein